MYFFVILPYVKLNQPIMRNLHNLFLALILIFLSQFAYSQNFSGNWDGTLVATDYDGSNFTFGYRMVIVDNGDGTCYGKTRIVTIDEDNNEFAAIYNFSGTINGYTLKFSDYELFEANYPDIEGFYWCAKSGTLYLSGTSLSGNVTGYSPYGDCMPAIAYLKYYSALE